jgi:hypothetical protein
MTLDSDIYVPAIRWRQGEYQALLNLSEAAKSRIVPLITVPPLEYDFEDGEAKKPFKSTLAQFQNVTRTNGRRARHGLT